MKRVLIVSLLIFSWGCYPELNKSLLDLSNSIGLIRLLERTDPPIEQDPPDEPEVVTPLTPPSISVRRITGESLSQNEMIDFGKVGMGVSGSIKTIYISITNEGEADLNLQSMTILGGTEFTSYNSGSSNLSGGQSTTIELRYSPSLPSSQSSTFEIASNSTSNGIFKLILNGEGESIDSGLTAYYKFSGNLNDSSGNGNHGILFGTLSYSEDRLGNPNSAVIGDGTGSNRFSVNLSPAWAWNSTYSATAWVHSSGWFNLLGRRFITNCTTMIVLLVADNKLALGRDSFSCGGWAVFDSIFQSESLLNKWVHIAYVVSAGNGTFYINGVPSGTFSIPGSPTPGSNEIQFLADNYFGPLNGRLDEVRIYNTTALTANQVQAIYNQD